MAAAEEMRRQSKWEGLATIERAGMTAEQVWAYLEDFCNAHKWLPNIDTCYQVEGSPGQPGLVRYCASSSSSSSSTKPSSDDSSSGGDQMMTTTTITWAKEKLIAMDPIQRCLTYEVIDNNMGMKSYVATLRVFPISDGNKSTGFRIEWSYVSEPFEGWRFEDLASYIDYSLKFMTEKMEHAVLQMGPDENAC